MPRETKQSTRMFPGDYLVFRLGAQGAGDRLAGHPLPTPRHKFPAPAIAEAERLNTHFPESTFVVMREIARVKQVRVQDR